MARKVTPDERRRYEAQKAVWARNRAEFEDLYVNTAENPNRRFAGSSRSRTSDPRARGQGLASAARRNMQEILDSIDARRRARAE